jgi:hypothetical protein
MRKQDEKSYSESGNLSESSSWWPKGWFQWILFVVGIFVVAHYKLAFTHWQHEEIVHSRWWLGLSPARQHLFSGTFLTAVGGFCVFFTLRYWRHDWDTYRILVAATLTLWGLYELFEAALLS